MEGAKSVEILVTGGAGFIGSHLVDRLMQEGYYVRVLDNLATGSLENISRWMGNSHFAFIKGDCLNPNDVERAVKGVDVVYHLAANPDVRVGAVDTRRDLEQNVIATYNILEAMRKSETAKTMVFASSSTVYGDAEILPTPESYAPLKPISLYGASKLACEAMISAYSHMFGMRGVIYRLANIIGPRSNHGVIHDFVHKLLRNQRELEVLGDGTQSKSYLYITDCIDAMILGLKKLEGRVEIYNLGSEDLVDVKTIANVVIEEMGLRNVELKFTGGVDGGRGWKGDVKHMILDISRMKSLGWKPRHSSVEAVRLTVREMLRQMRD